MCFPQINTQFDLGFERSVLLYQHNKKKQINQNRSGTSKEEHKTAKLLGYLTPFYAKGITMKITKLAFCFQQKTVKIFCFINPRNAVQSDTG